MSILVSFTDDASGPFLQVHAQEVEGRQEYGILPDQNPGLEDRMLGWAQERIERDVSTSFEASLDRFLVSLQEARGIDGACKQEKGDVRSSFVDSQKECVRRLVKMKCMWAVWGKQLYWRQRREQPGTKMGPSAYLRPVQDYLHQLAGQAVSEAEKDVLKEVDRLLTPISIREKSHPTLWSALNVVAWTTLWELMLIYRSTLRMCHEGQIDKAPTSSKCHHWLHPWCVVATNCPNSILPQCQENRLFGDNRRVVQERRSFVLRGFQDETGAFEPRGGWKGRVFRRAFPVPPGVGGPFCFLYDHPREPFLWILLTEYRSIVSSGFSWRRACQVAGCCKGGNGPR